MIEILDSAPENCTEIYLKPNGTWESIVDTKERIVIDLTVDGPIDVGYCPIIKEEPVDELVKSNSNSSSINQ